MNQQQRKTVLTTAVVAGASLALYLSGTPSDRILHPGWLVFAVASAVIGTGVFVYQSGKK